MASLHEQLTEAGSRLKRDEALVDAPTQALGTASPEQLRSERDKAFLRLHVVAQIVGGWIWETDKEHRFVYMSPSVEHFSGRVPEWHYGKTRQELGNQPAKTKDGQSWVEQLEKRASFGPIDFLRYQADKTLMMRTVGHPQFNADGTFTGYIGLAFEIPGDAHVESAERRNSPRRRIVRAAEITASTELQPIACVLVDISTSGAKLRVPADVVLPDEFQINVAALSLKSMCRLRWRRRDEIGVSFEE